MPGNGDTLTTAPVHETRLPGDPTAPSPNPQKRIRLGEELPVFCERCGYSLHGLPNLRCGHCDVLHFACPECNHHQPINTLRPAFQRMLGRVRSIGLALIVLLKINFFFWPLMLWGALGTEIAYRYVSYGNTAGGYQLRHAPLEIEGCAAIFFFAMAFALIGRMLLLRWRRGVFIGMAIGLLTALALYAGAYIRYLDTSREIIRPESETLFTYMFCAFAGATAGASIAWGLWLAFVHVFLPKRAAAALLEWQRAMSAKSGEPDRTDATTSVTA